MRQANNSRGTFNIATLDDDQIEAAKEFIAAVNLARQQRGSGPLSWATAVKFLMARKFDVGRGLTLYEQHESTRIREGLVHFEPAIEPLRTELETGKFTVLPTRDGGGAAIAVFTARLHYPELSNHQVTLQGVVYQLDVALESVDTQRSGLVFIYDMSDSKYANFDYDLSQKILTLLKGAYPARLRKVLIVTAPLWFKAPFKILRLFVREKLRDRVYTVSLPQLTLHLPADSLPSELGGNLKVDHGAWLRYCFKSMTNRVGDLCDISTGPNPLFPPSETATTSEADDRPEREEEEEPISEAEPSDDDDDVEEIEEPVPLQVESVAHRLQEPIPLAPASQDFVNNFATVSCKSASVVEASPPPKPTVANVSDNMVIERSASPPPPPSSASSGFSDDDSLHFDDGRGMTLEEFAGHVKAKSKQGLYLEYADIKAKGTDGTFNNSRLKGNAAKNRYTDVLCYDHSRVVLSMEDPEDICSDYINANYVDGYKQKNAFISTQGPLPKTYGDFWRMVWEQQCVVVVMTTRCLERGRPKCGQYWPLGEEEAAEYGHFEIINLTTEQQSDYTISMLHLTNLKTRETRSVAHMQFTSWPDYGVPLSATAMLEFLQRMRDMQSGLVAAMGDTWIGHPLGPPIVVHCSAGIGRTGSLCTIDICLRRLEDVGTIDVLGTVEKIRSQRAHSIQMPDQYLFCHTAILECAVAAGLLQGDELACLDDEDDSSDTG
ncbi:tyrosine-protein phosphatase non-receptor type 9 isoform X2 [Daphnia magna]|uniref:tyrosine-protein phosphatase non-receptor type 9 isoform X2 n=1 Tax=Daphnia magna TaxID=35525 RepID=UPI0006E9E46F|nr:tyrosine-protein phosphatase non-receptor type 9 isoform X2 [Daphnia magna]